MRVCNAPTCTDAKPVDVDVLLGTDTESLDAEGCVAVLGQVQAVRGRLAQFEARVSTRVEELHAAGESSPAAETHARSQRVSAAQARRRERRAQALRDLPALGNALGEGTITSDHVDAYASAVAKASEQARAVLAARQDHLVSQASTLTPDRFQKLCQRLVRDTEPDQGIDRDAEQRRDTRLRSWINAQTGLRHITGQFHPELGSRIWTAVQAEVGRTIMADDSLRAVDRDRLAAEALGRLVAGGHATTRPNRADLVVLTDLDSLRHGLHDNSICELSDSSTLPVESIRRLACDANIIPAVLDGDGTVLDLGRGRRLASAEQRTALRAMHDTCAFPGCDVPFDDCEIHHLLDWNNNGPTDLANLAPGCSRHHHLLHEGGWHARLNPDRTLQVWAPGQPAPPDAIPQARAGPHHHTERDRHRDNGRARAPDRDRGGDPDRSPGLDTGEPTPTRQKPAPPATADQHVPRDQPTAA